MKRHISIMVKEICSMIPDHATCVVDGTLGHGGHSLAMCQYLGDNHRSGVKMIGIERDPKVFVHGKEYLHTESSVLSCEIYNDSYTNIVRYLPPGQQADFVLLDLGINREHVTDNDRGFSIQGDGPLDMRFTPDVGHTAYELIKASPLDDIAQRMIAYADFSPKRAHTIAEVISRNKSHPKLQTTIGLIDLLKEIKIHKKELPPLFQAIRIATNREFDNIELFMNRIDEILAPGGRCAIITFHSIEDRIVKYHFKSFVDKGGYHLVNKHVITPHYTEVQHNKASRSAKLRVIEKE